MTETRPPLAKSAGSAEANGKKTQQDVSEIRRRRLQRIADYLNRQDLAERVGARDIGIWEDHLDDTMFEQGMGRVILEQFIEHWIAGERPSDLMREDCETFVRNASRWKIDMMSEIQPRHRTDFVDAVEHVNATKETITLAKEVIKTIDKLRGDHLEYEPASKRRHDAIANNPLLKPLVP